MLYCFSVSNSRGSFHRGIFLLRLPCNGKSSCHLTQHFFQEAGVIYVLCIKSILFIGFGACHLQFGSESPDCIWTKVYPLVNLVSTNVPGYFSAFWNACSLCNHSSIYVTICLQALTEITWREITVWNGTEPEHRKQHPFCVKCGGFWRMCWHKTAFFLPSVPETHVL